MEIRLLGRLEVRRGEPLELPPSRKARALLAYLVATERSHTRDHLASLLWDDQEDARAGLRWCLSRLRAIVDDGDKTRLVADRDFVAFERNGADVDLASVREALRAGIDRVSVETLERAAASFGGELLEGLELTECYAFHAWCVAEREAARALRASILAALVRRLADEPERVLPYARAQLDLDPLAGPAQAAVVRILASLGRQREAEELYKSFKHVHDQRGERASIELERARLSMRTTASTSEPPPALARLARGAFVGRAGELSMLTAALDGAVDGHGAFFELAGEAGMGKTRLLEELVHQARLRGARVLVGHCVEGEGSPAYLPFLASLEATPDLETLAGTDAALAARLFPRLAAKIGERPAAAADAASERYLVFQAVATLLERIAAPAGALLVLEDLHWIDPASIALLRYLATRLEGVRLLVVASYRDEEIDARHPLHDALAQLRRHGGSRVLLRGLADDEVRTLVTGLGGEAVPPPTIERLARVTGGHPLFLHEMMKHLVEENALDRVELPVPDGVRQVIQRRLARLSEGGRRLLAIGSAMVGAFGWALVREVSSDGEDALLDALEEVLAAQLLRETVTAGSASYEFSHALVAHTLYDGLAVPRRARLHRQIGEAIERVHARDLDFHLAALAHHFALAASDDLTKDKAADFAIRAAERAESQLGLEEAARQYARAVALLEGRGSRQRIADLHRRRGQALAAVDAGAEAREAFEAALAHVDADNVAWRAEVLAELGVMLQWMQDVPALVARTQELQGLLVSVENEGLSLSVGCMRATIHSCNGDLAAAVEEYDATCARSRGRTLRAVEPFDIYYWAGRTEQALARATQVIADARSTNDIFTQLLQLPPYGMSLVAAGRYREAGSAFDEARTLGERTRATGLLARVLSMAAGSRLVVGDVVGAEQLANEARELARMAAWTPSDLAAGIDLVSCRMAHGDLGAAQQTLDEVSRAMHLARGQHEFLYAIRLDWTRAVLAAARGQLEDVERWAAEALTKTSGRRPKYEILTLVTRGEARAKGGKRSEALADLEHALALARRLRDPALLVRALTPRLALDGSDELLAELRRAEQHIRDELAPI